MGGVILLDLRVLGLGGRALDWRAVSDALTPAIAVGFALIVLSGVPMAMSDARALAGSPVFAWKLALIGLAGVNALAFRRARWPGGEPRAEAQVQAVLSLLLWLGAVAAGRLLGYL